MPTAILLPKYLYCGESEYNHEESPVLSRFVFVSSLLDFVTSLLDFVTSLLDFVTSQQKFVA